MDFIVGLPRTQKGYNSIWVVVDRLTKLAHFFPVNTTYSGARLVELYISRIICMHGVWQNRLNYTGSNTQVLSQGLQRTSNGVTHWSVGSPSDTTTFEQDRCRFTSHEGEFTITAQLITFNLQTCKHYYKPCSTVDKSLYKRCLN
jgi:hypothetical protein